MMPPITAIVFAFEIVFAFTVIRVSGSPDAPTSNKMFL
jgi:hypothetical protein